MRNKVFQVISTILTSNVQKIFLDAELREQQKGSTEDENDSRKNSLTTEV